MALFAHPAASRADPGAAVAHWRIGSDTMALTAAPSFAGAVSSIIYRGREYLDAADHGREMQGAVQFGAGECLNPTVAGASRDPKGATSSVLLHQHADSSGYQAVTRMAYWDRPGQRCNLGPGRKGLTLNSGRVSDLTYSQDMRPGFQGQAHAVLDRIVITAASAHPPASVEALTAYMPPAFDTVLTYSEGAGAFVRNRALEDASAEESSPIIFSTADGSAAMGVVGLSGPGRPSYAGYRGPRVSKWSLVYRSPEPFQAGRRAYVCVWAIGSRREVSATLSHFVAAGRIGYGPMLVKAISTSLLLWAAWLVWQLRRRKRQQGLEPIGRVNRN